jgi:excisionase family DNA binding protein
MTTNFEKVLMQYFEKAKIERDMPHQSEYDKIYDLSRFNAIDFIVEQYKCFAQDVDPLKLIMGVSEAATRWGIDPSTVKKMCAKGQLPAVKIGDTWILNKDQERPALQKNYFVWQDHVIVNPHGVYYTSEFLIKDFDDAAMYSAVAHTIVRLSDPETQGNKRKSMKGSVVAIIQKICDFETLHLPLADQVHIRDVIIKKIEIKIEEIGGKLT